MQCVNCLRFFRGATALTQHVESQGVRCRVREKDNYDAYVDEVTASTAAVDGMHADNTVKYVVNALAQDSTAAKRVADTNAAMLKSNEKAKAEYWTTNQPKW